MNAFELLALAKEIISGKRNKKMTMTAIEAALADLKAERDEAKGTLEQLLERRRAAMLDGLDDAEIEAIEAQEKSLDRRLERLDLAEPALLKRLDEARSESRREAWKRNVGYMKEARQKYLEAARLAAKAGRDFIALRHEVGASFQEISLLAVLPVIGTAMVVDETVLAAWEAETERFFDALPVIDQRRDRKWDGEGQPKFSMDYRDTAPPAPIIVRPEVRRPAPAGERTIPDDRTFKTVAIGTRNGAPAMPAGDLLLPKAITEAELKTGEDGLLAVDFLRRYDDDGVALQPGQHRVTPAVAMAAMRAGAADLSLPTHVSE